jgi:hypothetical protein
LQRTPFLAPHDRRRDRWSIIAATSGPSRGPAASTPRTRFSGVAAIDLNAASSLRALAPTLSARGIGLHVAELRDDLAESIRASGAEADLGSIMSHRTVEDGLARAVQRPG